MKIDRIDQKILKILQSDGRISNQELAEKVGLSPSPCLRRLKALEESGIIQGYHASLDAKALGFTLCALIHISMDKHTPERFEHFESEIDKIPEIVECLLITGQQADFCLKAYVRDMDDYQELLLKHITRIEGVSGVHTSFILRQSQRRSTVPVDVL